MTGDLTPAPQMPEDVAKLPDQCQPTGDWRKVIADLNASDPQDMLVIKPLIEAQAAENADLRAKLAEVTAERDEANSIIAGKDFPSAAARLTSRALRRTGKAEAERDAARAKGFAQGIEAAANFVDGGETAFMTKHMMAGAIRALTPPVDARETPIRCHQAGLTPADEQQAPQADPVREAAQWLLRNVSGKTLREAGYVLTDTSDLDEFLALRALAGEQP